MCEKDEKESDAAQPSDSRSKDGPTAFDVPVPNQDAATSPPGNDPAATPNTLTQKSSAPRLILALAFGCTLALASILLNVSLLTANHDAAKAIFSYHSWTLNFGLIIVTAISIGISFWLYYVRSIYLRDEPALVPERFGSIIAKQAVNLRTLSSSIATLNTQITATTQRQREQSESLLENFLVLQEAISARDHEIERLRNGYDAKIFSRFLVRFIRLSRSLSQIREEIPPKDPQKNYEYLSRLLDDALEECGVEQYTPDIGSDYRDAGPAVADDPVSVNTNNEEQDYLIASVESPAFVIPGEGDPDVVVPAKVSIFRYIKSERDS